MWDERGGMDPSGLSTRQSTWILCCHDARLHVLFQLEFSAHRLFGLIQGPKIPAMGVYPACEDLNYEAAALCIAYLSDESLMIPDQLSENVLIACSTRPDKHCVLVYSGRAGIAKSGES